MMEPNRTDKLLLTVHHQQVSPTMYVYGVLLGNTVVLLLLLQYRITVSTTAIWTWSVSDLLCPDGETVIETSESPSVHGWFYRIIFHYPKQRLKLFVYSIHLFWYSTIKKRKKCSWLPSNILLCPSSFWRSVQFLTFILKCSSVHPAAAQLLLCKPEQCSNP